VRRAKTSAKGGNLIFPICVQSSCFSSIVGDASRVGRGQGGRRRTTADGEGGGRETGGAAVRPRTASLKTRISLRKYLSFVPSSDLQDYHTMSKQLPHQIKQSLGICFACSDDGSCPFEVEARDLEMMGGIYGRRDEMSSIYRVWVDSKDKHILSEDRRVTRTWQTLTLVSLLDVRLFDLTDHAHAPTPSRFLVPNDHVQHHYHLELGLFCFSTLTCSQENPTRWGFFREVRSERCHASRQTTETRVCRTTMTPDDAEVGQTDEMDTWIAADVCFILVRCSRARRFRNPLSHPVLEKHRRTN